MSEKKTLFETMLDRGIDPVIAKSMAQAAEKQAAAAEKKGRKKGYFPGMAGTEKPKKFNGSHTYTAVCATCGSKTQKTRIAQIDPERPLPDVVPVSICESCIPFYRTLSQDDLIALILIKDNENLTLRMLSHRQQINLARQFTPFDIVKGIKLEVDAPYEPEYTPIEGDETEED